MSEYYLFVIFFNALLLQILKKLFTLTLMDIHSSCFRTHSLRLFLIFGVSCEASEIRKEEREEGKESTQLAPQHLC